MKTETMKPISGKQAFEYFSELYRTLVPMERAMTMEGNPLRQQIAQLMDTHLDAVDDAVIQLSHAPDTASRAALIAALPPEQFYVLSTRWINNTLPLLQLGDQPAFLLPPEQVDLSPLIRLVLVTRTERIGSEYDLSRPN